MTPEAFFRKYRRIIVPHQLGLRERAFSIYSEDVSGNNMPSAERFLLKKETDKEKLKILANTFQEHDPKEVLQDLMELQRQCAI